MITTAVWYSGETSPAARMNDMLISAFIEPSVVSYRAARPSQNLVVAAHQQLTADWWRTVLPDLDAVVSPIALDELSKGDEAQARRRLLLVRKMRTVAITTLVRDLARSYLDAIALPEKAAIDALHVATATAYSLDYLVTWNCRHIANAKVIMAVEEVNRGRGLATPIICTPEVMMELR